jgi:PIN domain nuclease of toxin-antitoxin system
MNVLLDTHTLLWFIDGSPQLSSTARAVIEDPSNTSYASTASLWKIAIKVSLGKLILQQPFDPFIPQQLQLNGFLVLGIQVNHTAVVATLPFPRTDHRDPFDRLIMAQAMVERMPIVSRDDMFDTYTITRVW